MLLSEKFKKRLMELAGVPTGQNIIFEADNRNTIVNKLHIPKEISDWSHNLSNKYSIWIADSFKKYVLTNHFDAFPETKKALILQALNSSSLKQFIDTSPDFSKQDNKENNAFLRKEVVDDIQNTLKTIEGDYTYVLDWLRGRNSIAIENDQINFKTLTFDEAKKRSEEWHEKLKQIQGGKIEDEEGEVVLTFQDGFYWVNLGKDYCEKESKAMGHCGRASGSILYSLRKEQYPYVTAAVNDGVVTQIKGRANTKPKNDFHKYIIPFILGNNPNIQYFKSTYAKNIDFNINDLTDVELRQVVDKKPSLLMKDGAIAIKRLPEDKIQSLLVSQPLIFEGWNEIIVLSDILKNDNMIDWAIVNAPELFHKYKYGTLKLNKEQLYKALNVDSIAAYFKIDEVDLDDNAIEWAVKNQPRIFEESTVAIIRLNDSQKDYLVKNHPIAFKDFLSANGVAHQKTIVSILGPDRLKSLFISTPELFSKVKPLIYNVFAQFLTPELLENYIKNHNKQDDPLNIFNDLERLNDISDFMNINTFYFFLKHYPNLFWQTSMSSSANKEGGKIIGKYIIDHHFDWVQDYLSGGRNKYNIQNWELSPAQKQKIVNSDAEGDTTILINYDAEEIRKLALSENQKKQLLASEEFTQYLTMSIVEGFNLPENTETTNSAILKVLHNDDENAGKTLKRVEEIYGQEYVNSLYDSDPEAFPMLIAAVKRGDVNRLKKYNNQNISYTNEGIKIRFNDWTDEDLLDFFQNTREEGRDLAKQIAGFELDFNSYDYSFNDIGGNLDELDAVNIARVRFLIGKAFPAKYKKEIKEMKISQLVDILKDPVSISEEESVDYDEDLVDGIKDAFVQATEDAQRSADEDEYWKLYVNPITDLLGAYKFVDIKTKKKGEEEIKIEQMLEFKISYKEFADYIESAEAQGDYGDQILISDYVTSIPGIIRSALDERGEELKIDVPYYGVNGDVKKEDLNDRFNDSLYGQSNFSKLLDKTKVVVKNKKKNETK